MAYSFKKIEKCSIRSSKSSQNQVKMAPKSSATTKHLSVSSIFNQSSQAPGQWPRFIDLNQLNDVSFGDIWANDDDFVLSTDQDSQFESLDDSETILNLIEVAVSIANNILDDEDSSIENAFFDNIIPAEDIGPIDYSAPFDTIIQSVVTSLFISYKSAVRRVVNSLSDISICDILMRSNTSLLNMCQIAEVDDRAKFMAALVFNIKFGGHLDISEILSEWSLEYIKRFFELFGRSVFSLDVRGPNHCDLVLRYISAYCPNLTELQCTVTNVAIVDEMRPLFSRVQKLVISDHTDELRGPELFEPTALIECLHLVRCQTLVIHTDDPDVPEVVMQNVWSVVTQVRNNSTANIDGMEVTLRM